MKIRRMYAVQVSRISCDFIECFVNIDVNEVCFGFANQIFLIAIQLQILEQNCYSFLKVYFHHCLETYWDCCGGFLHAAYSSLENWRRPSWCPHILHGWRLPSRTWNQWTSPWTKQLTWLRNVHSGGWCLHLALHNRNGACQSARNEWMNELDEEWS